MEESGSVSDSQRSIRDGRVRSLANLRPFRKGQSGNPKGRPKSITLSEAYRRELAKVDPNDEQKRTFAEVLAGQTILKAKGGDVAAIKEIADRTEGKAKQSITLTLDKREQVERAVDHMIRSAEANGDRLSRDDAIRALSLFMPEASQLLH